MSGFLPSARRRRGTICVPRLDCRPRTPVVYRLGSFEKEVGGPSARSVSGGGLWPTRKRWSMGHLAPGGEQAIWPAPVTGAGFRDARVFCASYFADFLLIVLAPCILARSSMPLIISSPITFSTESCNVQPKTWATRPTINGLRRMESCNGRTRSCNAGMDWGW